MTETTMAPATSLAERVVKAVQTAGVCNVAAPRQAAGAEALHTLDYPTTRHERWKYTRVAKLRNLTPQVAQGVSALPPVLEGFAADRLTFINGQFQGGDITDANGLYVGPLSGASDNHNDKLTALNQDWFADNEWFAALQASAPQDGACILVPEGRRLDRPILVHHHVTGEATVSQPQHLIVIGARAHAEVIVWTTSDHQAEGLMNAGLTAEIGEHGNLSLEVVQDEHGQTHHIGHHQFRQAASSALTVRTATARAHWLRNDLHIEQGGHSDELYKGLATDTATAVFNGKIMVHPDAQRIEAYQRNANLLLGERAGVYSKPELEIYADDVRCSHGCTTGQFDSEALFYLQSRGMTETEARNLLVRAFLSEVLDGFRPEIKNHVEQVYAERLGWN
jgi:Fe-S cluster assembly protein SufD